MTGHVPSAPPFAGLVHGMGHGFVEPDWPLLTDEEVRVVLRHYGIYERRSSSVETLVAWHSPRPMSAAALVHTRGGVVFMKRHHLTVRTAGQLCVEHALTSHLRARGQLLPAVLRSDSGDTTVQDRDFVYEVHERAKGADLYRDAPSWSPFTSLGHVRAAGEALANFHQAAQDFPLPPRAPAVLMNSVAIIASSDPLGELHGLLKDRPGLARALMHRSLLDDFTRYHLPAIKRAQPLLRRLVPQWGHGDWHASNLTWRSTGPNSTVAGVLDLGLANRTFSVVDLAVALERNTIDWLDLAERGHIAVDFKAVDALLDGYENLRPLDELEAAALVEVLPVVHFEYALSEIEYFTEIVRSKVNSDLAYDEYLVGHTRWYENSEGSLLLEHLRSRAWRC